MQYFPDGHKFYRAYRNGKFYCCLVGDGSKTYKNALVKGMCLDHVLDLENSLCSVEPVSTYVQQKGNRVTGDSGDLNPSSIRNEDYDVCPRKRKHKRKSKKRASRYLPKVSKHKDNEFKLEASKIVYRCEKWDKCLNYYPECSYHRYKDANRFNRRMWYYCACIKESFRCYDY